MKKTEFDDLVAWGKRHHSEQGLLSFDTICFLPDGEEPENVVGRDGTWTCLYWLNFGNNDNDELRRRTRKLEVSLHGDEELQKIWTEAERTNVTPNIPEPNPGLIETFSALASTLHKNHFDVSKLNELEAKVGRLEEKLNSTAQPATKDYVDEAVARFSHVVYEKLGSFDGWIDTLEKKITAQVAKIEEAHFWATEYRKETERPSRVQSLIHAVTGNAPRPRQ